MSGLRPLGSEDPMAAIPPMTLTTANPVLRIANIQGNVIPSFNTPHQAFLFYQVRSKNGVRAALRSLAPQCTAASQIIEARASLQNLHPPAIESFGIRDVWVNIGLSF